MMDGTAAPHTMLVVVLHAKRIQDELEILIAQPRFRFLNFLRVYKDSITPLLILLRAFVLIWA